MTVAGHSRSPALHAAPERRLAVSWTVAPAALPEVQRTGFARPMVDATIVLEAHALDGSTWEGELRLVTSEGERTLAPRRPLAARLDECGALLSIRLELEDGSLLLDAVFRDGTLVYGRSPVPASLGLPGGTYDAPAGRLEAVAALAKASRRG